MGSGGGPPEPPFVGRDKELGWLVAGLNDALAGRGRLFLLSGEAGIGKTRLSDELAAHAETAGARVLWGRCWEGGGAPAYWPWGQMLRSYVRDVAPDVVAAQMGAGASDIARIAPDVGARSGATQPNRDGESEQARFNLFDSTASFLRKAAAAQPIVLVFDDLHAADESSLLLLHFLARDLRGAPMLVLGTYREAEVRRTPARQEILSALLREGQRLPLRGLSRTEVGDYLGAAADRAPVESLVDAIHLATDGNPFFVSEVVRLWLADGAPHDAAAVAAGEFAIPDEVRAAIRRRLDPLSDAAREGLAFAAVVGREFDFAVFERLTAPLGSAAELIAEAAAAGLVMPAGVGRFAFAHALMRQTLYGDLPASRRMALHREVGEALETQWGAETESHLADLAHHFFQAAPAGGADRAFIYARRAGDQALAQFAYAEAALHYERALHALDLGRGSVEGAATDAVRHAELLIAAGWAQRRSANAGTGWRTAFRRAVGIARGLLAGPERSVAGALLAEAALGFGRSSETGVVDAALVGLLEEALEAVGESDGELRTRLLSRLAVALYFSPMSDRTLHLSAEAVALARKLGSVPALLHTLVARHFALWRPDALADRLTIATEIVDLATAAGEGELALEGRLWRAADRLEAADIEGATADLETFARAAAALRTPLYEWHAVVHRGMRALADGRLDDVEVLAAEARDFGHSRGLENPLQVYGIQAYHVSRERGRLVELSAVVQSLVERLPLPIWRCAAALLRSEIGQQNAARQELDGLAAGDFAALPRDGNWLPAMAVLGETCVALGDRDIGARIAQQLAPYADRLVVIAQAVVCFGPVSYFIGRLAALCERRDEAVEHFSAALATASRLGAAMLIAQAQCALAAALLGESPDTPAPRAIELAGAALATATAHGLVRLQDQASSLLESLQAAAPSRAAELATGDQATLASPSSAATVFRKDGQYWTVAFDGIEARLKDARGLTYIAYLLRHAGDDVHTLDLAAIGNRPSSGDPPRREGGNLKLAELAELSIDSNDAGPLLDPAAKQAYRRRLAELREELDEATTFNDLGRAERARAEIDAITRELAAAVGIGNRDRKTGSAAERSRVAVTKAILAALRTIAETNPSLRRYFAGTLKTGQFCSYTPDPRFHIRWDLD